jgi:hypothetical protein
MSAHQLNAIIKLNTPTHLIGTEDQRPKTKNDKSLK